MDIDAHARSFANGPRGRWLTAQGTFDVVMSDEWIFQADGRGRVTYRSRLSGESTERFRWRCAAEYTIALCFEDSTDAPVDEGPDDWTTIAYELTVVEHDVGREVVLRQLGAMGFWFGPPLRYAGPCE